MFQTDSGTVQAIWQQATTQGVIPQALAAEVPGAVIIYALLGKLSDTITRLFERAALSWHPSYAGAAEARR